MVARTARVATVYVVLMYSSRMSDDRLIKGVFLSYTSAAALEARLGPLAEIEEWEAKP